MTHGGKKILIYLNEMKYINNIAVYATLIFAVKKMFFDNYIDLGVIDRHYGIVFFIFLLVMISCRILNKKRNEKQKMDI